MLKEFFSRKTETLVSALSKARDFFRAALPLAGRGKLTAETLVALDDLLIQADFGRPLASKVMKELRAQTLANSPLSALELLKKAILQISLDQQLPIPSALTKPQTVMIVGVNGHGKTTTCAKLAAHFKDLGHRPLLIAADTFRAAGSEQLGLWSERLNVEIVQGKRGEQPAAVVFDGMQIAVREKFDLCLIDSAGRLHNQHHLMQELQKMQRVCNKVQAGAPHEILLIVEAPTGQNAIEQVKKFASYLMITGIVLTKLDGSAKGGIALAIQQECKIPVRFIGTGEGVADFKVFEIQSFINALFDSAES